MTRQSLSQQSSVFVALISVLLLLSLGCTRQNSSNANLTIQLPRFSGTAKFGKAFGLTTPESISDINCFMIGVEGSDGDMSRNTCKKSDGTVVAKPGRVWGGYLPGSVITGEISSGTRTIYVVGLKASTPEMCVGFRGKSEGNFSAPVIVGKKTVQVRSGNNDVNISVSMTNSTVIDDCSGPDFPTPSPSTFAQGLWSPHGTVNDSLVIGNTLYLVGEFGSVGPMTGSGLAVDLNTGVRSTQFDYRNSKVDGAIYSAIPDGTGGWFIGGNFMKVGNSSRPHLARIKADGSLDPWEPTAYPDGTVLALAMKNSVLYVGGAFNSVGASLRYHLASYNVTSTTATLSNWAPDSNFPVQTLMAHGNDLYVGGHFTNIASSSRNYLAKFDSSDSLSAWNPSPDAAVYSFRPSNDGTKIRVGGGFTTIASQSRDRFAEFNATTGVLTSLNLGSLQGIIWAIGEDAGGNIYVGGDYLLTDPTMTFNSLLKFSSLGILDTSFQPFISMNQTVYSIAVVGSTIYVGGDLKRIDQGGTMITRLHAAAVTSNGVVTAWNPFASDIVWTMALQGSTIYLGSEGNSFGGVSRARLAALDLVSGLPTNLDIEVSPGVPNKLSAVGADKLLVSGPSAFQFGGEGRRGIAMVDLRTGLVDPNVGSTTNIVDLGGDVKDVVNDGTYAYVAGDFMDVDIGSGLDPNFGYLFRLSLLDGTVDSTWMPAVDGAIYDMELEGTSLYIGGDFITVGISPHEYYSRIDAATALADSTLDGTDFPDQMVTKIAVDSTHIYLGGFFSTIGSVGSTPFMGRVDKTTGIGDSGWISDLDAAPSALYIDSGSVLIGGAFTTAGGSSTNFEVARVDKAAFTVDIGFDPMPTASVGFLVNSISVWGSRVLIGGDDSLSSNGNWTPYLMNLDATTGR